MTVRCTTLITTALSFSMLTGCTAVRVSAVAPENRIEHICIEQNPDVIVRDFVSVMQKGFELHGLTSEVVQTPVPAGCTYSATYTARQTWDLAVYMSEAQISILRDGQWIASANYHLRGKGGLALNKWASTETKMLPVIDSLLTNVARPDPNRPRTVVSRTDTVAASKPAPSVGLTKKLSELKDAYDAGLIPSDEYEAKRKALIQNL
jgi:hypothetical protein